MVEEFINSTLDKSRREVLINLMNLLNNKASLETVAGKNALLDCALYVLAKNDSELLSNLNEFVSVEDLLFDIKHTKRDRELKKLLKERLTENERI